MTHKKTPSIGLRSQSLISTGPKSSMDTIFDIKLDKQNMMGMDMALFPADQENGKVSGALVKSDQHKPSGDGAKIYLNGNPDLAVALGKVEKQAAR